MHQQFVSHFLPNPGMVVQWRSLLDNKGETVYETYLRYYLQIREQLDIPVDNPTTFGFYTNTPYGDKSTKTGALFHKVNLSGKNFAFNSPRHIIQHLNGPLDDLGLDFLYQRKVGEVIQQMPGDDNFMFVYLFDTPHAIMDCSVQPGLFLDDGEQHIPGHEFFKLCDRHDNKVFAIP